MSVKGKSKSFKHGEQGSPLSSKSRFWGVCCESGKKYSQVVAQRFHITMAALEPSASDDEDFVSLMVERGGAEYLLCSLKHNAIMQVNLNLIFEKGENVTFFLRGQGTVHLSGYHENSYADGEISNTTESSTTEIKKAKKLGNLVEVEDGGSFSKSSVDKNANTSKTDSRKAYPKYFDMPSTSKGITSKQFTSDDEEDESSEDDDVKSSTPKGKTGLLSNDLVQTLTENIDSDEDDDDDDADFNEFDEEEESEDDDDEGESEDEEDVDENDDDYSSGDEVLDRALEAKKRKRESDAANSLKRLKKDNSLDASKNSVQDAGDDDEQESSEDEESENGLCITMPLPKKSSKKQGEMSSKKKSDDGQKKHLDNNFAIKSMKPPIEDVEFEDIRLGYGPCAKPGKFINVFYTGKLPDGKVFDQITQGKPFGFKLGSGQVIKGWEVGLEGMKVGGKRRIKIPPHLGYGSKPTNGIPPNSTLIFIVELKSVN